MIWDKVFVSILLAFLIYPADSVPPSRAQGLGNGKGQGVVHGQGQGLGLTSTQPPTQPSTQPPIEPPIDQPTQLPTQPPTEVVTVIPDVTESYTEPPTEPPTQVITETTVAASTAAPCCCGDRAVLECTEDCEICPQCIGNGTTFEAQYSPCADTFGNNAAGSMGTGTQCYYINAQQADYLQKPQDYYCDFL